MPHNGRVLLGSTFLNALFLATVTGTLLWLMRMLRRPAPTGRWVLPLWLAVTGVLAYCGLLPFDRTPPPLAILLGMATLVNVIIAFSAIGKRIAQDVPLVQLVGFQVFRIAVEIFLALGHREGIVPVQMTLEGRNFDIVSGLTAGVVAFLLARGIVRQRVALLWNLLGLGLLINIIAIAILSMPTPLRMFHNDPPNTFVAHFPYVWLPAFLVQAALFGHLMVFRKILLKTGLP